MREPIQFALGFPERLPLNNRKLDFATLGSLNVEPPRNAFEAQGLIDTLFACENAELTAGGKKITVLANIDELEKKFQ